MSLARHGVSQRLSQAIDQFAAPAGYLAAATIGLPVRATLDLLHDDLDRWSAGEADPSRYDAALSRTRAHYARLVGVAERQVAIGSQTSVMTSVVAAAVPPGTEVLCVAGDFSSIVFPFLQRSDIRVRHVPLDGLADAINDRTWLVAFSLVQSATGQVADVDAILREAHLLGAHTLCDTTQAAGVMTVDASRFDVTVCHAYKWLCSPRGVAFMTLADRFASLMRPLQAGWYAGADVGESRYGPTMRLAEDARRFDVSPVWQAWLGAEPAIALFADLDLAEVWGRSVALGDALCEALGFEPAHQAIVTWPDPDGRDLRALTAAGIRVAGRAGRLRAAFHLWNDESDVEAVVSALGR